MKTIQPFGDRVLIKPVEPRQQTASGHVAVHESSLAATIALECLVRPGDWHVRYVPRFPVPRCAPLRGNGTRRSDW